MEMIKARFDEFKSNLNREIEKAWNSTEINDLLRTAANDESVNNKYISDIHWEPTNLYITLTDLFTLFQTANGLISTIKKAQKIKTSHPKIFKLIEDFYNEYKPKIDELESIVIVKKAPVDKIKKLQQKMNTYKYTKKIDVVIDSISKLVYNFIKEKNVKAQENDIKENLLNVALQIAQKLEPLENIKIKQLNCTIHQGQINGSWEVTHKNGGGILSVDTILAGGYNIQQLHIRNLVNYAESK